MGSRTPFLLQPCGQRRSNPLSYDGLRFHTGLAMSAAPRPFGLRNSATRCCGPEGPPLPFGPLRPTGRPCSQLCPRASGPVRDPATTARRRSSLRIGRVPLTCLVPSPHKLGLQSIAPCGAPSAPFPHLFGVGGLEGTLPVHSSPPHRTLRTHAAGSDKHRNQTTTWTSA